MSPTQYNTNIYILPLVSVVLNQSVLVQKKHVSQLTQESSTKKEYGVKIVYQIC